MTTQSYGGLRSTGGAAASRLGAAAAAAGNPPPGLKYIEDNVYIMEGFWHSTSVQSTKTKHFVI